MIDYAAEERARMLRRFCTNQRRRYWLGRVKTAALVAGLAVVTIASLLYAVYF